MQSEQYLEYLELVDALFEKWNKHFSSRLKDRQFLDLDTARLWAAALVMLKATNEEIDLAFAVSITKLWPPTTPADFLELIRSEVVSEYPNSDTAYIAAANGNYLHAVCHETAMRIGTFELRNQDGYITSKKWDRIYKEVCIEHSQNAAKFNQNIAAIQRKRKSDTPALAPKISLEAQSAITQSALEKTRKLL